MRLHALIWVSIALGWPVSALAQGQLVCRTVLGWCEVPASTGSGLCWCDTSDDKMPGKVTYTEEVNLFSQLKADILTEASRAFPQGTFASRSFAGPNQLPPDDFKAYGVVVFKARASGLEEGRHLMICEAYVNAIAHTSEIDVPKEQQMVTIWPVTRDDLADEINGLAGTDACKAAVANYGLVHAQNALAILDDYRSTGGPAHDTSGRGPFLVAWAPAAKIAKQGSVVLFVDLSSVDHPAEAGEIMGLWRDKIQDNPDLWRGEVKTETLVDVLRRFFDRNGALLEAVEAM